jgi:hypothetical protein
MPHFGQLPMYALKIDQSFVELNTDFGILGGMLVPEHDLPYCIALGRSGGLNLVKG